MTKLKENTVGEINRSQENQLAGSHTHKVYQRVKLVEGESRIERYMGSCCSMGSLVTKNE